MTETSKTLTVTYDRADERSKVVPLKWPFTVNGTRYESVTVRRISTGDLDNWVRSLAKGGSQRPPEMLDMPPEIFGLLDVDDSDLVDETIDGFLPRRYRRELAGETSNT